MIPVMSIVFMAISFLLCLVLSFGLFIALKKKLTLKLLPAFVGAAAFIVFALILEQLLHSVVLKRAPDGSIELMNSPALYALYGIFAAGIFEETARLISFKVLKRKFSAFSTAISYGIGHGGIEALILTALTMASGIVISIMQYAGTTNMLGDSPGITASLDRLRDTESWLFLISGVERISAMAIQISLSAIVWHSVNTEGKMWYYPLAICLHAAADLVPVLYQLNIITNILIVETTVGILAAAIVVLAIKLHGNLRMATAEPIN